jgi:hypothetical protein
MNSISLIITAIILPVAVAVLFVLFTKWRRSKDKRKSPLNQKRLHLPGEQLRLRIEKLTDDMQDSLTLLIIIGPAMLAAFFYSKLRPYGLTFEPSDWVFVVFFLVVIFCAVRKLNTEINQRRIAKEGLSAELITAQNLLLLMGEGCLVFNDIPANSGGPNAKSFNIDHVVIGPHAVFMIETKSRKKSTQIDESWKVFYDGKTLRFPDHADSKILEQAKAQARWLLDYLNSATGENVKVVPVVALPGWFVENQTATAHSEVVVSNCRNPKFMLSEKFGLPISEAQKRRISHAITQRYPEIEM